MSVISREIICCMRQEQIFSFVHQRDDQAILVSGNLFLLMIRIIIINIFFILL